MCSGGSNPLAELQAALDALAAVDPRGLTDTECEARLVTARQAIARLEGDFVRTLRTFDARQGWVGSGARSLVNWLRSKCHLTPGAAKARRTLARRLDELPLVAEALSEGSIDFPHAHAIASKTADLPTHEVAKSEHALVELAAATDPAATNRALLHLRYLIAPDQAGRDAEHAQELRWLDVSRTFGGMVAINGLLDPEAGETVIAAIDALCPPPRPGDTRTPSRKRADAAFELCRRALDSGQLPTSGGERPHINVVVPLQTLLEGKGAGEFINGEPLDNRTIHRLLCDAMVSRVITDTEGEVLNLGRRTRVISPAQRRALAIRDKHCRFDGCDLPAAHCDAHHIIPWLQGGPTDLNNEALLCRYHHTVTHNNAVEITRHDGQITIRLRDGPRTKVA